MNDHHTCPECGEYAEAEDYRVRRLVELRPARYVQIKTRRIDVEVERLARLGWAADEISAETGLSLDEVAAAVGYGRLARHRRRSAQILGYAYLRRVEIEMDGDEVGCRVL